MAERMEILLGVETWGPKEHREVLIPPHAHIFDAAFAGLLWSLVGIIVGTSERQQATQSTC